MEARFFEAFLMPYLVVLDTLSLTGIIYFYMLPKEQKANTSYWLPLVILLFTCFFENMGAYCNYNTAFNKEVNAFFGNTENPRYNLWLYNIANKQISTILYLFLIKSWLKPSKKKYINWMLVVFISVAFYFQIAGIEPIYSFQPIIFAIGANMMVIGIGLYFIGLITDEAFLNSNPVKLISFWQMTFLLFTYSLSYINSIALEFFLTFNEDLGRSLLQIDIVMGVLTKIILVLTLVSPNFPKLFEREPSSIDNKNLEGLIVR
ncbi:histidine kinase [Algoriphagus aquimarinus]|uniref:Uncharacterized protein n=1 Tax=Algoriphagus aquimarinus TaxID=237018 RepID=A0A1I1CEG5_9BACT|nr:histidine kinase [Algoriphagus aquimarinus]SFB61059.1 hypothetical protein SAMN04489723_13211 [Algoriphagus aquimarinus]